MLDAITPYGRDLYKYSQDPIVFSIPFLMFSHTEYIFSRTILNFQVVMIYLHSCNYNSLNDFYNFSLKAYVSVQSLNWKYLKLNFHQAPCVAKTDAAKPKKE